MWLARFLGALIAAGGLMAITQDAHATPIAPNGSFTMFNFTVASTSATTTGGYKIGPNTTSVTLPGSEVVQAPTDPYLGNPYNLGTAPFESIALSTQIFSVGSFGITTTLGAPFTFGFATNQGSGGVETFKFTTELATSSGNGDLSLYFTGSLMSDTSGYFQVGAPASLSIGFTESAPSGAISPSYSFNTPPSSSVDSPEPASLAVLGAALAGLGFVRRRRLV